MEQTKEAVRQEADTAACKPNPTLAGAPWLRRLQDALSRPLGSLYGMVSTRVAALSPAAAPGVAGAAAPNAAAAALDTATVAAMRRKLIGPNTVRTPCWSPCLQDSAAVTLTRCMHHTGLLCPLAVRAWPRIHWTWFGGLQPAGPVASSCLSATHSSARGVLVDDKRDQKPQSRGARSPAGSVSDAGPRAGHQLRHAAAHRARGGLPPV